MAHDRSAEGSRVGARLWSHDRTGRQYLFPRKAVFVRRIELPVCGGHDDRDEPGGVRQNDARGRAVSGGKPLHRREGLMARVTAGVATSHVPAVGAAIDLGKTREPYWAP